MAVDAAPLVGAPSAPVPDGAEAEWVIGAGGVRLRAALFPPKGRARGSVVLSPGRTEFIEKYFEVAARLNTRGFVVLIHDWRGQGLADRPLADRSLGHVGGRTDFLDDHGILLGAFESRLPKPWFALSHSMGGCLTLLALAKGETRFSGAILSAPMLGILTGAFPTFLATALAEGITAVGRGALATPEIRVSAPPSFETNILTHDRRRYERNEALLAACPDLALGPPTWGWLKFAFSATAALSRRGGVEKVSSPVLAFAAGDDLIVDNAPIRRVIGRLPHGRVIEIPGAYHEILQETDSIQAIFWDQFDAMIASLWQGQ